VTSGGETWDVIAALVYYDETMTGVLLDANPELGHFLILPAGKAVHIPVYPDEVLDRGQHVD